ncbi:MAG: restriction endonuclease subunit S, partial [Enterococcus hirae]|nr:restriction endonuclease subunit S [Enterococcus hirae]
MSKLDYLIRELCPHGIKYTELRDVCDFQNGFSFKSALFKEIGLPILRITNIQDGNISASDYVFFDREDYKESLDRYKVKKGDIVVAMSGATTGKIGYYNNDETLYLNQRVGLFKPNEKKLNRRFLFHWLCTKSKEILNVSCGSGAQPNLSSNKMMSFCIPIPPLPVQEEIVRILDNFTELTAELIAELTARKRQYEYYQNLVFKIGNSNAFFLEDIAIVKARIGWQGLTKKEYLPNGFALLVTGIDFKNGKIDFKNCHYVTKDRYE